MCQKLEVEFEEKGNETRGTDEGREDEVGQEGVGSTVCPIEDTGSSQDEGKCFD